MSPQLAAQFQNTNFTFTISEPGHENIDFQCQQFSGMGITIGTTEHAYAGIQRKYPGDSLTVNPLSLTIILDDRLFALEQIYDHIFTVKNLNTNEEDPEHTFTGILTLYDSMNYPIMKFTLDGCWIENIGDLTLNSAEADNTNITLDIAVLFDTFAYERIEV